MHDISLLTTLAAGFVFAFLFGLLAVRLRLPPILGYLLAGIAAGPYTPGFVGDAGLAAQLSEIGVILLMFGVGLHFSFADLLSVRRIAVPGALVQVAVATGLGAVVARLWWGLSWGSGLVFGLSLSVASTVVLLRALEDRGIVDSADGRIAIGWLIVEDLITVLALVALPALAGVLGGHPVDAGHGAPVAQASLLATLTWTVVKVLAFGAVMLIGGRRVIPWLLDRVVRTGSRELFTLAILGVALGIAVGAALLFDVSFALGAFFAGVIVSESDFSHEAATNALPLQDAFAVLFFVSVGMLFDPHIVVDHPGKLLAVVGIILGVKALAAFALVLLFRYSLHTALTIAASLAQVGEFSFILVSLGVSLGLLTLEVQSLVVAGAILSITVNPFLFRAIEPVSRWLRGHEAVAEALEREPGPTSELPEGFDEERLRNHVVVIGSGRVGGPLVAELAEQGLAYVVVEQSHDRVVQLRSEGLPVIFGDATRPDVLHAAHLERARLVVAAAPDAYQARAILALVRELNPTAQVLVRAHSDEEREFLQENGASRALVGERELAISLTREVMRRLEVRVDMEQVAVRMLARGF